MLKLKKASLTLLLLLALSSFLMSASADDIPELSEGKVAVMFWSSSCSTCEKLLPHWRAIERNPPDGFKVIDIELIPGVTDKLFQELGISETPTFIVFDNGKEIRRISGDVGGNAEEFLRDWMEGRERSTLIFGILPFSILGGLVSLSPCSLPLTAALVSASGISRKRDYFTCFLAVSAGVAALGLAVILLSVLATQLVNWLSYGFAIAAMVLGTYSLISPERACRIPKMKLWSTGKYLACFGSAFVMIQCNFPILTGSLILLGTLKDPVRGFLSLISLSLSMSLSLIILLAASKSLAAKFTRSRGIGLARLSGAVLLAIGAYYLISL